MLFDDGVTNSIVGGAGSLKPETETMLLSVRCKTVSYRYRAPRVVCVDCVCSIVIIVGGTHASTHGMHISRCATK